MNECMPFKPVSPIWLMVETHNNPKLALCDGAQSLDLEQFDGLMTDLRRRAVLEGREI